MIRRFLLLSIYLLLSSCSTSIRKSDSNLSIDDFSMTHFENNGDKLYSISSPKSVYMKDVQIYKLDNTKILFYEDNKLNYIINSKESSLLNNNKDIKLDGNVKLLDLNNNLNKITANTAFWNIDKYEFILIGDVVLNNNSINILSSKAIFNKKENIIKFSKPVKYRYLNTSSNLNYNVKADNAYYDLNKNTFLFESKNERIKSNINF
tara:strand:- start:582 stop:1202 length:621 start_codon:yes stop_codon:yes gene_type:complete